MLDFLARLFESDFMPHGHCFFWAPEILWLYVVSDITIVLSYFTIPIALIYLIRQRRDIEFNWIFFMFATFIFACGTSHLIGLITLWYPTYRLEALIKLGTGIASLTTAIMIWPLLPKVIALPSPAQLRQTNEQLLAEVNERLKAETALQLANEDLELRVAERTAALAKVNGMLQEQIRERQRAEDHFRAALEHQPNAIIMTDANGQIALVNSQCEKLFGYQRDELVGHSVELLVPDNVKEQHPSHRQSFLAHPVPREMGSNRELYARRKDGSEFPVEIGLNPLETGEGHFVLSAIIDITERQHQQREVERINRELVQHNEDLNEFTYVASHDLREPVRNLISYSALLREDLGDNLPTNVGEDLYFITDAAYRMQALIEDLLQFSRAGSAAMKCETIPLDRCVDDALLVLHARIEETGAQIERLPLPEVGGDPTLLTQLYQNLLGNALKFHGDAPPRIELTAERHDQHWLLGVRDHGIGIDAKYAEQIFAPFRRLHAMDAYEGTGIGLSICRKTIERHGGRIWVESQPGSGAHFQFTLPDRDPS